MPEPRSRTQAITQDIVAVVLTVVFCSVLISVGLRLIGFFTGECH